MFLYYSVSLLFITSMIFVIHFFFVVSLFSALYHLHISSVLGLIMNFYSVHFCHFVFCASDGHPLKSLFDDCVAFYMPLFSFLLPVGLPASTLLCVHELFAFTLCLGITAYLPCLFPCSPTFVLHTPPRSSVCLSKSLPSQLSL